MILFDVIMTLIESIILSYFTFKILEVRNRKILLLLDIVLCFSGILIFNYIILNNFLLLLFLIVTNFVIIFFITKEYNLYYFIIPSILIAVLLFSNTMSMILTSCFFKTNPKDIGLENSTLVALSLTSRVIYLLLSLFFYLIEKKLKPARKVILNKDYWIVFCIFTFVFLGIYTILYESAFYNLVENTIIYKILFLFTILIISFFILYFRIQKDYYNHILISNELLKSHYTEEIYKRTNKLSYKILQEKHQMFYILIKIKNHLKDNDTDMASIFIDEIIKNYQAFELFQTLNIPDFDYHIINCINLLKEKGYAVTTIITVKNNKILENMQVINIIKECIELMAQYSIDNSRLDLHLYDNNSYLILKITTPKQNNSNPILSLKSNIIRSADIITNGKNEIELRVLFYIE